MVAIDLNEELLRKELIQVYERYIQDPLNPKNIDRFSELDKKYSGASDLICNQILINALNNWSFLWQKNILGQEDHSIDPKKILEELRKSE